MTVPSDLLERDVEALLRLWPDLLACPTWRLWGESPSVGLLHELRSASGHEWILRDERGWAVGVLQVRDVDRATASGSLGFLVQRPGNGRSAPILPFLREARSTLELRKITLMADDDMLDALADVTPHLPRVGLLREHALATAGRYVDRHVFELTADDEADPT